MRTIIIAGCLAALAGCAPADHAQRNDAALAAGRPIGDPVDCVNLIEIDHTRVRNDRTIDFVMKDRRVMRNTLPNSCPGLGFEERFSYATSLNRLCSVDTITVLQTSGTRGASCGLGSFQQVELPPG